MPNDDDTVQFTVGHDDSSPPKEWQANVKCTSGLTEEEFAVALQSLADDILKGRVAFDSAPEIEEPKEPVDPDLH